MAEAPRIDPFASPPPEEIVDVRLDQANSEDWVALAGSDWSDAQSLYGHLSENTNILEATRYVPLDDLLPNSAVVLDLGCGSGWLTGLLTRNPRVERVLAWDASRALLADVLPAMVALTGGDLARVTRLCGSFLPLLLPSQSIDLVAMSSAFHHSARPDELLIELCRITKPGGAIVLLNEVPHAVPSMLYAIAKTALAAAVNSMTTRVSVPAAGHVAAGHLLYDEKLGDRTLTIAQWHRLFRRHGVHVETIVTPLPSYPSRFRRRHPFERNLTHFVLRPPGEPADAGSAAKER